MPPVPEPLPFGLVQAVRVVATFFGTAVITDYLIDGVAYTKEDVTRAIDLGLEFYTLVNGHRAMLEVVTTLDGSRYVRTQPDGIFDNNLLRLSRF